MRFTGKLMFSPSLFSSLPISQSTGTRKTVSGWHFVSLLRSRRTRSRKTHGKYAAAGRKSGKGEPLLAGPLQGQRLKTRGFCSRHAAGEEAHHRALEALPPAESSRRRADGSGQGKELGTSTPGRERQPQSHPGRANIRRGEEKLSLSLSQKSTGG